MKRKNVLTGPCISDIDYSAVKPDQILFPTVGFRVFNRDGKGMIASVLPGNDEYFSVTKDFYIIGAYEFQGIGFIFSFNRFTLEGEIGTFPSPNLTATGFTKVYRPLKNYKIGNGPAIYFRTTLFNFQPNNILDIKGKISYDESIDLYVSDFMNPDRVFNCGFSVNGLSNNRFIHDTNFNGFLNFIPSTKNLTAVAATPGIVVSDGGRLEPGNYFLYFRYLTADYNKTNFVVEAGPVSVSYGETELSHMGLQEQNWVTKVSNYTSKKIRVPFTRIDENYSYFQVAVIRYSSLTENAAASRDVYLIDKYYQITGSNMVIEINGTETRQILTYDEVLKPVNQYTISRSKTQVNNRLLRANLKCLNQNIYRDVYREFAQKILIKEDYEWISKFQVLNKLYTVNAPVTHYDDDNRIDDHVGYFKGEIYPFGIVIRFTDGTESEVFPCRGNIGNGKKGLYKFRTWQQVHSFLSLTTPTQKIISLAKFDPVTLDSFGFMQANPDAFVNVVGFFYVRGDRIENLICQGLVMKAYYGVAAEPIQSPGIRYVSFQTETYNDWEDRPTTGYDPQNASQIPLFRGALPISHETTLGTAGQVYGCLTDFNFSYKGVSYPSAYVNPVNSYTLPKKFWQSYKNEQFIHKHGLFSTDIAFNPSIPEIPADCYVDPLFYFDGDPANDYHLDQFIHEIKGCLQNWMAVDFCEDVTLTYQAIKLFDRPTIPVNADFVEHNQAYRSQNNFVGYLTGYPSEHYGFIIDGRVRNRNIGISRYVGFEDLSSGRDTRIFYNHSGNQFDDRERATLVNLYRRKNDSTFDSQTESNFNVGTTFYGKISVAQDLFTISYLNVTVSKGDCFLQKSWLRTHRWYSAEIPSNEGGFNCSGGHYLPQYRDVQCNYYQHGLMIGIVTENRLNTEMRNEVPVETENGDILTYTFFTKFLQAGYTTEVWAVLGSDNFMMQEAVQINMGYNITLSDIKIKGFEVTEPPFSEFKPNRVDASNEHIPGSFVDGYRSFELGSFQDFALEDGEIFCIGENMQMPFLVQRNGINQIFINEKTTAVADGGTNLILGQSVTLFSPQTKKIGWFGTQHQGSVINGSYGSYGVDMMKRTWWMVTTSQAYTGQRLLDTIDLGKKYLINDELNSLLELHMDRTIKTNELPELRFNRMGITAFKDPAFDEIGMTFMLINKHTGSWYSRTMVYNEKLNFFRGDLPFTEPFYFNIGKELFSSHQYQDDDLIWQTGNEVYIYDVKTTPAGQPNWNTFFGQVKQAKISFAVTGLDEKESVADFKKIFNSMIIEAKHELLAEILYTTQFQQSVYDFRTSKFWMSPKWKEHAWNFPITKQTSSTSDEYKAGSEMQGTWLKITFIYDGNEDFFIKGIETDFTLLNF